MKHKIFQIAGFVMSLIGIVSGPCIGAWFALHDDRMKFFGPVLMAAGVFTVAGIFFIFKGIEIAKPSPTQT